jgi:sarcosine oxidase subunit alpha
MNRIEKHPILQVPREAAIPLYFSGRKLPAREGEVVSSALFAHGI